MYPGYSPVSPATPIDPLGQEPNESPVTTPEPDVLNDDDEEMPTNDKSDDKNDDANDRVDDRMNDSVNDI
jgi:hypothetical protein